ncbi:larval cuticle protein 4-like [Stomoxys calcitrans]|uniref:larval cuticle protein 4-like n=1 Tax=Stomoxys calcitrans TaxID=35570 RepID=UPI0027E29758|nr:larval cuticle protein 4-like [Stomoxys calcitrans]
MLKYFLLLAVISCAAVAEDAETLKYNSDVNEHGFQYDFETSNHIHAQASGDDHGAVKGDFEWHSPEGEHIHINYVADDNGYQPQSDILPTPPPIPEAIAKAIQYIQAHGGHA